MLRILTVPWNTRDTTLIGLPALLSWNKNRVLIFDKGGRLENIALTMSKLVIVVKVSAGVICFDYALWAMEHVWNGRCSCKNNVCEEFLMFWTTNAFVWHNINEALFYFEIKLTTRFHQVLHQSNIDKTCRFFLPWP